MSKSAYDALKGPTTTVPVVGDLLGLSKNKAYEAAAKGEIPILRFGKRIVVPTMPIRRMLGIETATHTQASHRAQVGNDEGQPFDFAATNMRTRR
jgi:hypothetical protein